MLHSHVIFSPLVAGVLSIGAPSASTPAVETPPGSAGHALVYHAGLRAVLLVNAGLGGASSPPATSRTTLWRWTGTEWVVLSHDGPPIRNLGGVAYDARRNRLVMYGGTYSQELSYGDTWEWDSSSGWQELRVNGPGVRDHMEMVYDANLQRIVLFGGQLNRTTYPGDTWSWDGTHWQQLHRDGPVGRVHYGLTYDPTTRTTYLFGGSVPGSGRIGDTWSLGPSGWTAAAPASVPRSHARLGVTSRGVILLGGFPQAAAGGVQRLSSSGWQVEEQQGNPGARYLTAMAYDPERQVTVLFGGGPFGGNTLLADTWEFHESTGWQRKQ